MTASDEAIKYRTSPIANINMESAADESDLNTRSEIALGILDEMDGRQGRSRAIWVFGLSDLIGDGEGLAQARTISSSLGETVAKVTSTPRPKY